MKFAKLMVLMVLTMSIATVNAKEKHKLKEMILNATQVTGVT